MMKNNERHALVLSGGGGFGAFEIGVLRALVNGKSPSTEGEPLEAEIFTGTSVGAYNAAVLASKWRLDGKASVAHLEDLWLNRIAGPLTSNGVLRVRGNPLELLDPRSLFRRQFRPLRQASSDAAFLAVDAARRFARFWRSNEPLIHRAMEMFDLAPLLSTEPLGELVRETISLEELLESHRVLKIAATNWRTGDLRVFVHDPARKGRDWKEGIEENLTETTWPHAVLASTAIPGIFPAVRIGEGPYVDGGVVMNTPLRPAIDSGATVIHQISMNLNGTSIPLYPDPPNTADILARFLSLSIAATVDNEIETARLINKVLEGSTAKKSGGVYHEITVHRYQPEVGLGGMMGMLDFRRDCLKTRIEAGELTAVEHDCEKEGCLIPNKQNRKPASRKAKDAEVQ